jgi:hypothetical protein
MKKKEKKEQTDDSDQNPYKNHFFHLFSFSPKRVGAITFAFPGGKRITSQGETSLCGAKLHVARLRGTLHFPARRRAPVTFPLRGRCHGVTDEVVSGIKRKMMTFGLFLLHLIRRYTPPSPQGEGLERSIQSSSDRCWTAISMMSRT